jgi:hypothetical protein
VLNNVHDWENDPQGSFEDDNPTLELEDGEVSTPTHNPNDLFNTFYTIDRSDGPFQQPGSLLDDDSDESCLFIFRKCHGLRKTKGAGIYAFGGLKWIRIKPLSAATDPCS